MGLHALKMAEILIYNKSWEIGQSSFVYASLEKWWSSLGQEDTIEEVNHTTSFGKHPAHYWVRCNVGSINRNIC